MKGFSRRAQRKQERLEKKQKRNHFFQQKKNKVSTENFNKPQIVDSNDPGLLFAIKFLFIIYFFSFKRKR